MFKLINKHKIQLLILVVGLFLRLYRINLPLLDAKPHREIHTAEETRNLYYDHEFLYPKTKLWADEPGYYIVELPIYNAIVAIIYSITHSTNEIWGRLVSVSASFGLALYFYRLTKLYFGKTVALWSLIFFYIISPQEIVLSRAYQPDQLGLFFGITSLYYFSVWLKKRTRGAYGISWACFMITLLIKISFFPLAFPMLYLTFKKWRWRMFLQTPLLVFTLTLLPTLIWYLYVKSVYALYPTLHSAALVSPANWLDFYKLLDLHWYVNIAYDFIDQIITLPVLFLSLGGLFLKFKPNFGLLYSWLFGLCLYGLAFIGKIHFWYYQVPFLFPLVILAGATLQVLASSVSKNLKLTKWVAVILVGGLMFVTGRPYLLRTYAISERHRYVLQTAKLIKKMAPAQAKIIASSYDSAALTYYGLRPDMWGGTLVLHNPQCLDKCIINNFEALRKWGADIYAASNKRELDEIPEFKVYLEQNYKSLINTDSYVIYDLRNQYN